MELQHAAEHTPSELGQATLPLACPVIWTRPNELYPFPCAVYMPRGAPKQS